jgi:hypothetical protein
MDSKDLVQSRYDYFLIWGHGMKYKNEILDIIAKENNFEILLIIKHKVKNIKKFVKKVYEYDYVPYSHLIGKTKYLINAPKEVMFVFIKNLDPQEIWKLGHGTGHIESKIIVKYKDIIRNQFNEKKDDNRTENHVIHASDNETQVHYILKYLEYNNGVCVFDIHREKPFKVHYLLKFNHYMIHQISIDNLVCNTIEHGKIKTINIDQSPQYRFLLGFEDDYKKYIDLYQGYQLKSYYNLAKYKSMSNNFTYLSRGYEDSFILVKKFTDKYIVLDGLHRVSIAKFQGFKKITAVEVL